jgi:UDP-N-acetylmuramoylalanine--D-glutamate ligase
MQAAGIPAKESFRHLYTFQPLPHRLEHIGTFGGIEFYNDSISTVPQSAMAAVDTLEGLDALILGGFDRGLNYSEMVDYLNNSTIGYFFFIGQAGKRMHELFQKSGREKNLFVVTQLEEVFEILAKTPGIKKCLLSPAAASYDQFTNFEHRGEYFRTLAQGFKKSGV